MGLLSALDRFDRAASDKIHTLELPKFLEYFIYIFAKVFNGEGNFLVILLVSALMPNYDIPYAPLVCFSMYF